MERMIEEIFPKVYEINQPPQGGMNESRKHITRKSTKLAPSKYGMIEQWWMVEESFEKTEDWISSEGGEWSNRLFLKYGMGQAWRMIEDVLERNIDIYAKIYRRINPFPKEWMRVEYFFLEMSNAGWQKKSLTCNIRPLPKAWIDRAMKNDRRKFCKIQRDQSLQ